MLTKNDIQQIAETVAGAISHLATKEELKALATKEDLKALATKEDLRNLDEKLDKVQEQVAEIIVAVVEDQDQLAKRVTHLEEKARIAHP